MQLTVLSRDCEFSLLNQGIYTFFARAEVAVKGALKVGLAARELKDAIGVSLDISGGIKTGVEEHWPAALTAAISLSAMEWMLDCSVGESELAVDLEGGANCP